MDDLEGDTSGTGLLSSNDIINQPTSSSSQPGNSGNGIPDDEGALSSLLSRGSENDGLQTVIAANGRGGLGRIQATANFLAHFLALCTLLTVSRWISLLGGLSWQQGQAKLVFNWHPLLMIVAFCFMTVASLSFRFPLRSSARSRTKLVHGMAWLVASLSACIALIAVFKSHNDKISGYIANLYSFHSWLGLLVISIYVIQFLAGAYSFWWSNNAVLKACVLKFHVLVGPPLYFSVGATILLGIQEKEGFVGCSYKVDAPDTFFPPQFRKIPAPCVASHMLGIFVFLTMISAFIALHNTRPMPSVAEGGMRAD